MKSQILMAILALSLVSAAHADNNTNMNAGTEINRIQNMQMQHMNHINKRIDRAEQNEKINAEQAAKLRQDAEKLQSEVSTAKADNNISEKERQSIRAARQNMHKDMRDAGMRPSTNRHGMHKNKIIKKDSNMMMQSN